MTRDELTTLRDGIAKAEGERLLATLRDSSGLSVAALAEAAHVGRSTAEERLRQLAARGAIGKNPEGRWKLKGEEPGPPLPPSP